MTHDNGIRRALRWLIVTTLLTFGSAAGADDPFELRPASASYRLVVNGIPLGLEARVNLDDVGADQWQLRFLIDSRLVYHREQSRFHWRDCSARPSHYEYLSKGFGIKRGGGVTFDWDNGLARSTLENFQLPALTVDSLAASMMARCHLARGDRELNYVVADPRGLIPYHYRVLGREALETPAGIFDTLHLERVYPEGGQRTELWVAVDLNYFMVRMDHAENPLMRGRIELTGIGEPGETAQAAESGRHSGSTVSSR